MLSSFSRQQQSPASKKEGISYHFLSAVCPSSLFSDLSYIRLIKTNQILLFVRLDSLQFISTSYSSRLFASMLSVQGVLADTKREGQMRRARATSIKAGRSSEHDAKVPEQQRDLMPRVTIPRASFKVYHYCIIHIHISFLPPRTQSPNL